VVVKENVDIVRAMASKMKNDPNLVATLVGKADTVGSSELNEHLAQKRAQTVFEALVYTNGVPEQRVEIRFTGEHVPVVPTADEQADVQNRMVAIVLH
jgi:outer membrane protein OmpA-like peptidoglycan-associated protein